MTHRRQTGGFGIVRVGIDGLNIDARIYDARNENLVYRDLFQWRVGKLEGRLWWHDSKMTRFPNYWGPFNGYSAPQAGGGQD